ncbi:acetyltransferase [Anaeromyces robustus]|uniref:Acetyltransferase n=1 Tax=Anaeromyces robustus TaxID=1754192 RepID=A0A1Y1WXE8_9FUNG|nr:acetyltransferase [Anaeromyces robustus]|eukprot:ORX78221.1 acetyltransferase [Anaeromyces robustus]
MSVTIKAYEEKYVKEAIEIWNEIVKEGIAFPQEECLTIENGHEFFKSQSFTGLAFDNETNEIYGLYILHPNNVGHCGHIANASYAVKGTSRGKHVGEKLVLDSLKKGKELGFRVLQFNAVVVTNIHARNLYLRCGFKELGIVPGGFRMPNGEYVDIMLYYHEL